MHIVSFVLIYFALDSAYEYALVAGKNFDYLWI
ncbi:Uncharacterised protein [Myroides odoratus]|nr:hypothetical protein HMPREF9716_02702 [Myroides odoratus CIP 103059]STZ31501.1 Uncharacterised protein [Myroides odoratus]